MKSYLEVVKTRYSGRERNVHIYDNPYSIINPIGFYLNTKIRKAFFKTFNKLRLEGLDLTKQKILDVGCGCGDNTRFFAEIVGSSQNIYGMDLSNYRIEMAKKINSSINYTTGDIVNTSTGNEKFDLIMCIDVLSHLNTKEQISTALNNIYNMLEEDGYFIWYDINSKQHFVNDESKETMGYNINEMINFSCEAGFEKCFYVPVCKKLLFRYHSAYLCNKLPMTIVTVLEKILPGSPGNILMVLKKVHN